MRELLELLASMLRPEIATLLDRLEAELARTPAGGDCCVESLKALRLHRNEFFPAMTQALERGCARSMAQARQPRLPARAAPPSAASMRLLDDSGADEEGTLEAIAARHEHRASLSLLLLGQRFGVLGGSPPLAAGEIPVGPRALGEAMSSAAHRVGLCLDAKMILYRLHDMQLMPRYPGFAEALDACADRSGVLPGLAFVPLRPTAVAPHPGRGQVPEAAGPPAPEAQAVKIVNEALDALRQVGSLPQAMAVQRSAVVAAMAKFLLRHGQDSSEWQECVRSARVVLDAARLGLPPPREVRAWIENALGSIGYSGDDARKLASDLSSVTALQQPVGRNIDDARSAREQRCFERLSALSLGTRLGFSTVGGFMRSRLRYHYKEPGLLLLANEADGQEALFEIDAVARQMAAGQVWVIRHAPGGAAADVGGDSQRQHGSGGQWPQHAHGRELS